MEEYRVALNNKFYVLQELKEDEVETIDRKWKKLKEAVTSACKEVLSPKKYEHKEWITAEALCKIWERKEKKAAINNSRTRTKETRAQEAYTEANKAVKKNNRPHKRSYIEGLATEAEEPARRDNFLIFVY